MRPSGSTPVSTSTRQRTGEQARRQAPSGPAPWAEAGRRPQGFRQSRASASGDSREAPAAMSTPVPVSSRALPQPSPGAVAGGEDQPPPPETRAQVANRLLLQEAGDPALENRSWEKIREARRAFPASGRSPGQTRPKASIQGAPGPGSGRKRPSERRVRSYAGLRDSARSGDMSQRSIDPANIKRSVAGLRILQAAKVNSTLGCASGSTIMSLKNNATLVEL